MLLRKFLNLWRLEREMERGLEMTGEGVQIAWKLGG
jgi:hypothetical protein